MTPLVSSLALAEHFFIGAGTTTGRYKAGGGHELEMAYKLDVKPYDITSYVVWTGTRSPLPSNGEVKGLP
jgi:hypothetical protein